MNHEEIETKKKRIVAAAHSIGLVVQHISREGTKTVITFKKAEKPLEDASLWTDRKLRK